MFCKMDVDDGFAQPRTWRRMACGCAERPVAVEVEHGCRCPSCSSQCRECPGFGFAEVPERKFLQILRRIRSVIRRGVRRRGRPPGFVRLAVEDVRVIGRKRRAEDRDHWIHDYVEPGPPLRIFDVMIVTDKRRKR
jgi:hypothetical protein